MELAVRIPRVVRGKIKNGIFSCDTEPVQNSKNRNGLSWNKNGSKDKNVLSDQEIKTNLKTRLWSFHYICKHLQRTTYLNIVHLFSYHISYVSSPVSASIWELFGFFRTVGLVIRRAPAIRPRRCCRLGSKKTENKLRDFDA